MVIWEQVGATVRPLVRLPERIASEIPDPVVIWRRYGEGASPLDAVRIPIFVSEDRDGAQLSRVDLTPIQICAGHSRDVVWVPSDNASRASLLRLSDAHPEPIAGNGGAYVGPFRRNPLEQQENTSK